MVLVDKDRPYAEDYVTLDPEEYRNPDPDQRRPTQEEIEKKIRWLREDRIKNRKFEEKLIRQMEQENQ